MALLDRFAKGVSKAADQAKFEAEKLRKVTALNSEVSKLKDRYTEVKAAIGDKVLELQASGVAIPELAPLVEEANAAAAALAAKEEELARVKATEYDSAPAEQPVQAPAESEEAAGSPKFCPNCGAGLAEGAKFCPECGAKVG